MKSISSRDNPLYKRLLRLATSSRERRKVGKCLLDGMHLVAAYYASCGLPETVIVSAAALENPELAAFLARHPQIAPVILTPGLFQDVAQVAHPQGIIAIGDVPHPALPKVLPDSCVLLEGIQDPGNLGSILRSAAAAGIQHIFLAKDCAFAWSPKSLRAGMGAHFALTIHEHANLVDTAQWFAGTVIATLPRARQSLYETDLGGRVAWLLGSEGEGLSTEALALATHTIAIPMAMQCESLNVAAAAAICFFERARQLKS